MTKIGVFVNIHIANLRFISVKAFSKLPHGAENSLFGFAHLQSYPTL